MDQLRTFLAAGAFALGLLPVPGTVAAQDVIGEGAQDLPLFDAHMHWKEPACAKGVGDKCFSFAFANSNRGPPAH